MKVWERAHVIAGRAMGHKVGQGIFFFGDRKRSDGKRTGDLMIRKRRRWPTGPDRSKLNFYFPFRFSCDVQQVAEAQQTPSRTRSSPDSPLVPPERPPKKPHLRSSAPVLQATPAVVVADSHNHHQHPADHQVTAKPMPPPVAKRKPPAPEPLRSDSPDDLPPPPPPLVLPAGAEDGAGEGSSVDDEDRPLPPPPPPIALDAGRAQSPPTTTSSSPPP